MGLLPDDPFTMYQKYQAGKKADLGANRQLTIDQQMADLARETAAKNEKIYSQGYNNIFGGPTGAPTGGGGGGGGTSAGQDGLYGPDGPGTQNYAPDESRVPREDMIWDPETRSVKLKPGLKFNSQTGQVEDRAQRGPQSYTAPTAPGQPSGPQSIWGRSERTLAQTAGPQSGVNWGGIAPGGRFTPASDFASGQDGSGSNAGAPLLPGSGYLPQAYNYANQLDSGANNDFSTALASIQDPTIRDYVGDVVSQGANAGADPADIARQRASLDQLQGQTGVRETAEEKMLRYMARQQQEQQQKSDRLAFQNELRGRGVSGSGAETGMFLGSAQARNADRTLSELGANANAQKRAMDALGQYTQGTAVARGQSAQESQFRGSSADKIASLNNTLKEQHNQFETGQKVEINTGKTKRAALVRDAKVQEAGDVGNRAQNAAATEVGVRGGAAGNNTAGFNTVNTAGQALSGGIGDAVNYNLNKPTPKFGVSL